VLIPALALGCTSPPKTQDPQGGSAASPSAGATGGGDRLAEVAPDPRETTLAQISSVLLPEKHLLRKPIDDELSREAFPVYLEQLDGIKLLFLQEHVAALTAYELRMDDQLRGRNLVLARKGAALAAERRKVVARVVADTLARPFDFTVAEEVETDPKKRDYCKTESELQDRWRAVLKLEVLERVQQMEDILEARNDRKAGKDKDKGKSKGSANGRSAGHGLDGPTLPSSEDPADPDAADDAAAEQVMGEIPATFEGREEKARKEIATRYETRFIRLAAMEPIEPAERFLNAIAAAYDPHTQYLAPADKENFDLAISGTLEGIGAVLREQEHYIAVQELVPGGPAWTDGKIHAGDLILAVAQENKAAVHVTDMPIDKVVQMIRGRKGTVVTLTIRKPEGDIESISIKRDVVKIEAAYARGAVLDLGADHDPVGYVFLPGFYGDIGSRRRGGERNATDDVRALLGQFQKRKLSGVIVDLRGNGGGLLNHATDISGLFIDRGPIVQVRDPEGRVEVLSDADPAVAYSGNVVVMVDRFSASASEILAGALQDYERAVIVGTGPTHGKGTVQGVVELDQLVRAPGADPLGVFKLTMQQYFRVNGASTQWRGVVPDVVLPDPMPFVESGERTLPHSIPWTSVDPLDHARLPHAWKVAALVAASRERVKRNPAFGKVESFGKLVTERRRDTTRPLELQAWLAERKRDKDALEAADPKTEEAKARFAVDIVADPAASPAASKDKKLRERLDAWKDGLARDVWVEEALRVVADMTGKR
jgi:carboxyl-terminal processing protease